METRKLYQEDVYLKEWTASVTSIEPIPQESHDLPAAFSVTLDATAFFPEGGGQSCDLGSIDGFKVTDVQERDGQIHHRIEVVSEAVPAGDSSSAATQRQVSLKKSMEKALTSGSQVLCTIDWQRRFDNMQRHCGEHILSGIFFSEYGGVNRGFHMGHDYMTIDISLEEDPNITEITYHMALKAELLANKVIWSDAPVTVMRFDSREEAEKMPLRKALAFDEDISIVSVGSIDSASDCVACCGTHPNTAGQVGLIKIYKVEAYKGMSRIYFEAGSRALKDYDSKHDTLTALSNRYSSSIEDFPGKLKAREEKLSSLKNELFYIKKAFIDNECAKLDALIGNSSSGESSDVVLYHVEILSLDDTFNMAKKYMGTPLTGSKLLMLFSEKDTSYILISNGTPDCGSLVKEYASFYKGKGGGNKVSARAIFTSKEDALLFADLIQKHLRH